MNFFKLFTVLVFLFSNDIASQKIASTVNCFQIISGTVREKPSNKVVKNATIKLLKGNHLVKKIITSSKGSFSIKVACNNKYAIVAHKSKHTETKKYFTTSNASNIKVEVTLYIKQEKSNCTEIFNGRVIDVVSNLPIKNVTVEVRNNKNELIATDITNLNGNYHFNLNCKKQFNIFYFKEGYIDTTTEIKTTRTHNKVQRRDIILHKKICNQTIKGVVLDAQTNKPIVNGAILIINEGVEIKKLYTNTKGIFSIGSKCESNYTIKVSNANYKPSTINLSTSLKNNKIEKLNIKLQHIDKKKPVAIKPNVKNIPTPTFEIKPFNFELNSSEITKNIAIELDKIVGLMIVKPTLRVEFNSYTDCRGPENYNLSLSQSRIQTVVSYLIANGIESSRITGKGYGETKLLHNCCGKKQCTETQHQQNKRVEVIFFNQ